MPGMNSSNSICIYIYIYYYSSTTNNNNDTNNDSDNNNEKKNTNNANKPLLLLILLQRSLGKRVEARNEYVFSRYFHKGILMIMIIIMIIKVHLIISYKGMF